MNIYAATKVFDLVTRQAMFIEQVKLGEAQQFNAVLAEIDDVFRKHMSQLNHATLDALSKAQLNAFLVALRRSQSAVYSRYQQQLINRLNDFMGAAVVQTMRTMAAIYKHDFDAYPEPESLEPLSFAESKIVIEQAMKESNSNSLFGFLVLGGTVKGFNFLWSKIANAPLPSGGALLVPYINTAIASAMLNVENSVRNGYANRLTPSEVVRQVTAKRSPQGTGPSTTLSRTGATMRAVLATTTQHVVQNAISAAASAIWPEYVWVSIIDERTSDVCRERNMRKYRYGEGPLPPAHTHCRSHTMPFDFWDSAFELPTFFEWLKRQPLSFIKGLFGSKIAAKFEDGSVKRSDFEKFAPSNSISIADFLTRTGDLL